MSDVSHLLSDDHIDLITSAAQRWLVLTSSAAAALSPAEACALRATATGAGRALREENAAALAWLTAQGRSRAADRLEPRLYENSRVARPRPVEVIKAAHAAEELCKASPSWPGSFAARVLDAVVRAACHRLDGYPQAPWAWTRPERRSGPAVAVGGHWRPTLPGLVWIDPGDLEQHWATASLVLITTEVVQEVSAGLATRAGVFVLAGDQPADEVWHVVTALGMPSLVLWWPTCQAWLADQVADPAAEYVARVRRAGGAGRGVRGAGRHDADGPRRPAGQPRQQPSTDGKHLGARGCSPTVARGRLRPAPRRGRGRPKGGSGGRLRPLRLSRSMGWASCAPAAPLMDDAGPPAGALRRLGSARGDVDVHRSLARAVALDLGRASAPFPRCRTQIPRGRGATCPLRVVAPRS